MKVNAELIFNIEMDIPDNWSEDEVQDEINDIEYEFSTNSSKSKILNTDMTDSNFEILKQNFIIPVNWEVYGLIEVEAISIEEAITEVEGGNCNYPTVEDNTESSMEVNYQMIKELNHGIEIEPEPPIKKSKFRHSMKKKAKYKKAMTLKPKRKKKEVECICPVNEGTFGKDYKIFDMCELNCGLTQECEEEYEMIKEDDIIFKYFNKPKQRKLKCPNEHGIFGKDYNKFSTCSMRCKRRNDCETATKEIKEEE